MNKIEKIQEAIQTIKETKLLDFCLDYIVYFLGHSVVSMEIDFDSSNYDYIVVIGETTFDYGNNHTYCISIPINRLFSATWKEEVDKDHEEARKERELLKVKEELEQREKQIERELKEYKRLKKKWGDLPL